MTLKEKAKFAIDELKEILKSRKSLKKQLKGKTSEEKTRILQKLQQRQTGKKGK